MRRFKKIIGQIVLLTSVVVLATTPMIASAADYSLTEANTANHKTEITSKPSHVRGAVASVSNADFGGEQYQPYFKVKDKDSTAKNGSLELVGIGVTSGLVVPLSAGDEGGGNVTISYFSVNKTKGKSKNTNPVVKQDEMLYSDFYKAEDGFWYKSEEGDRLQAYRPVKMGSYNLLNGQPWTSDDFGGDIDAFQAAQRGSIYVFVPVAMIKDNGGSYDKSGSFPLVAKVTKKKEAAKKDKSKADVLKEQQAARQANIQQYASQYPNVGDRPSTNTLLAYIMYTKGGSNDDAIKDVDVSFGEIKYYPAPSSNILTDEDSYKSNKGVLAYAEDSSKGSYIPNSINMASTPQEEGKTLANLLRVYGGWGYISVSATATDTNSTTSNDLGSILEEIWTNNNGFMGFTGNVVLTLISPILWIVSQLLDVFNGVANAFMGMITGTVNIFGNPLGLLKIMGTNETGKSDNWLVDLAIAIKDYFFSNDIIEFIVSTINTYKDLIFTFWLLFGFVSLSYRLVFRKNKYAQVLNKWFFKITAPFVMIVLYMVINGVPLVNNINGYKANEPSDKEIDMLKFGVAFNFDLRKVYDFDSNGQPKWTQLIGSENIELEDWSLTSEQIKNVNQKIEDTLGSELSADLSQHAGGSSTFDVNTYLSGIARASKSKNRHLIAANKLPDFNGGNYIQVLPEGDKTKLVIKGAPMLKTSGGSQHSADYIPVGYDFSGYSYIFTQNDASIKKVDEDVSTSSDDESKSTEYAFMSGVSKKNKEGYVKQFSIGYYGLYWKATPVSLSKPWTYLYGATTNNNAITEHPSTYMYGAGESTQIANLRRKQGEKLDDNDKAPDEVQIPQLNNGAYNANEQKQYFYWKYVNAYNIALLNKYMGTTSDMDVSDLQLSNQSVVFLLQSQLKETELRYFASNLNHSDAAKSKSGSKTSYIYNRFVNPQKSDDISTLKITGFFMTLAYSMILFIYVKTIATMSISDYIIGRWKAMFAAFGGSWSNAVYYSVLTWFWGVIAKWIPDSFQWSMSVVDEAAKRLNDSPIGNAGGFGVGFGVLVISFILCYPFVKVADKKIPLIVGLVYLLDVLRLVIKGWLFGRFGLDSLIYQGNEGGGFGALLGLATGGLLGAKDEFKQRLGNIKESAMDGVQDDTNRPTTEVDGEVHSDGTVRNDDTNRTEPLERDGAPVEGLPEGAEHNSPIRKGLGDEPTSKPTVGKRLMKTARVLSKPSKMYAEGVRIATTGTLSAIGLHGLAKGMNKTVGAAKTAFSPVRKRLSQGTEKVVGKSKVPKPTTDGKKMPTAGQKPMLPQIEGKARPTVTEQEKPIPPVKDNSKAKKPKVVQGKGNKPIKKTVHYPNKRKKRKKRK